MLAEALFGGSQLCGIQKVADTSIFCATDTLGAAGTPNFFSLVFPGDSPKQGAATPGAGVDGGTNPSDVSPTGRAGVGSEILLPQPPQQCHREGNAGSTWVAEEGVSQVLDQPGLGRTRTKTVKEFMMRG